MDICAAELQTSVSCIEWFVFSHSLLLEAQGVTDGTGHASDAILYKEGLG